MYTIIISGGCEPFSIEKIVWNNEIYDVHCIIIVVRVSSDSLFLEYMLYSGMYYSAIY